MRSVWDLKGWRLWLFVSSLFLLIVTIFLNVLNIINIFPFVARSIILTVLVLWFNVFIVPILVISFRLSWLLFLLSTSLFGNLFTLILFWLFWLFRLFRLLRFLWWFWLFRFSFLSWRLYLILVLLFAILAFSYHLHHCRLFYFLSSSLFR